MKLLEEVLKELKAWSDFNPYTHPIEEILNDIPPGQYLYRKPILIKINEAISMQDAQLVEEIISVATYDGVDESYTESLCSLLKSHWHYSHEDILLLLEEIKSAQAISDVFDFIISTAIPNEDISSIKKGIWVLESIDTDESRMKIEELKNRGWI